MSDIRSDPYRLKDPDDNDAFSVLKDDVRLVKQQLLLGTTKIPSTAGLSSAIDALGTRLTTDEAAITALQAAVAGISQYKTSADWAYFTGAAQGSSSAPQTLVWTTLASGTLGTMNFATGVFTLPAIGVYQVNVFAIIATTTYPSTVTLNYNNVGSTVGYFKSTYNQAGAGVISVSALVFASAAGATFSVYADSNTHVNVSPTATAMTIVRL